MWSTSKGSLRGGGCHEAITTVVAMVARCRDDSLQVLTKDSAVTGAQLCQYGSSLAWHCLFGCSNGLNSANKQF